MKKKTGTKEWSNASYNVLRGCQHNCRYCYAHAMARRFDLMPSTGNWADEELKRPYLPPISNGKNRWCMFPTTHDITPTHWNECETAIDYLLSRQWKVLIVTKPHLECVKAICYRFQAQKDRLMFRFSIGHWDSAVLRYWEPLAPSYHERYHCLILAKQAGFATSVSMEPMLGPWYEMAKLVGEVCGLVTDKIWLGKMRLSCVQIWNEEDRRRFNEIKKWQTDEVLRKLVDALRNHPKVAWKDSMHHLL